MSTCETGRPGFVGGRRTSASTWRASPKVGMRACLKAMMKLVHYSTIDSKCDPVQAEAHAVEDPCIRRISTDSAQWLLVCAPRQKKFRVVSISRWAAYREPWLGSTAAAGASFRAGTNSLMRPHCACYIHGVLSWGCGHVSRWLLMTDDRQGCNVGTRAHQREKNGIACGACNAVAPCQWVGSSCESVR